MGVGFRIGSWLHLTQPGLMDAKEQA